MDDEMIFASSALNGNANVEDPLGEEYDNEFQESEEDEDDGDSAMFALPQNWLKDMEKENQNQHYNNK